MEVPPVILTKVSGDPGDKIQGLIHKFYWMLHELCLLDNINQLFKKKLNRFKRKTYLMAVFYVIDA